MKKFIFGFLLALSGLAFGATFNLFSPASGVLKGNPSTYVTTSATSTDVKSLWTGTCDNTTYLRGDGSCQTPPGVGGGTVNSVGLSAPSVFSVTGSPVTSTGTLALAFATGQTANQFLATPDGTTGALSLRSLVLADLPSITVAKGGTGAATLLGVLKGNGTSAIGSAAAADVFALWSGTCSSSTYLRGDGSCQTPSAGTGTVTSVAMTMPSGFNVTGSPVTTSGTLAISGILNPAAGGTGVVTLTGIAKGNGASAFTVAASGDVRSLWGGTCDGTTYLRGDGTCQTPPTGGSSANPSASVGLATVNGSASTFMRSDAAPALSQSITPTWTGAHSFTAAGTAVTITNNITAGAFTGSGASLTSLNAGNISTGTLAVARGGTGVTSSTGSGSIVLSSSPSLTSPALGTPSSVNLANASNIPLSSASGNLSTSHLNSGSGASSSTFWRGDGIWATPAPPTTTLAAAEFDIASGSIVRQNGAFSGVSISATGYIVVNFATIYTNAPACTATQASGGSIPLTVEQINTTINYVSVNTYSLSGVATDTNVLVTCIDIP